MKIFNNLPTPKLTGQDRLRIATYVLGYAAFCFAITALNLSMNELPTIIRIVTGLGSIYFVISASILVALKTLDPYVYLILLGNPDTTQLNKLESINKLHEETK